MVEVCPKCSYRRNDHEVVPDWQCPACGIVYAKWQPGGPATSPARGWQVQGPWLDQALARSESAQSWPLFVPLQLLLAYWALRYTLDPAYGTLIEGVLTPIHELGHFVTMGMGPFLCSLSGSLFQWGFPLAITLGFLKRQDLYAACVGLFLLGVAFNASYIYMDSTFQMEKYPDLTFVALGDGEASHDWQVIFGALKMYRSYTTVALGTRVLGLLLIWTGTGVGAWLLWRTLRARGQTP